MISLVPGNSEVLGSSSSASRTLSSAVTLHMNTFGSGCKLLVGCPVMSSYLYDSPVADEKDGVFGLDSVPSPIHAVAKSAVARAIITPKGNPGG